MERARILIVDDRPDNLLALRAVLEPLDVDIVSAGSGREALLALLDTEFALVVLDVQMPDMDGFETARLIKGRERTRLLPIIFLTAISGEHEHHLAGYRSGAVDYVYKPFDAEILRAKVLVFVELWARGRLIEEQRRSLADQLATLDRLNGELEHSNATLNAFAERAAEDLLEPLDDLSGFMELLHQRHGDTLGPDGAELVERACGLADRQRARVAELLEYTAAARATVRTSPVELEKAVAEAAARAGEGSVPEVTVEPGALVEVCADRSHLVRILELLIRRAAAAEATAVTVTARADGPLAVVTLADDGRAAGPGELATLFSLDQRGRSMGTVVSRRLVERHGGAIWAEPSADSGTRVSFTLPGEAA
jgi:CheY-like chemotaxis protein